MNGEPEDGENHDVRVEVARAWDLMNTQHFTTPEDAGAEAAEAAFKRALRRVRAAKTRKARRR